MAQPFESLGIHEMAFTQSGDQVDPTVDVPNNSGAYGYAAKRYGRPETLAPVEEETGGFLFLPGTVQPDVLRQLVVLAGLGSTEFRQANLYGLQVIDAPEGMERELGYMRKLVIADRFALRFLFRAIGETEYGGMPEQPLDAADLVVQFTEDERSKYGTHFGHHRLEGRFGGDGNFARESLGFGFAIENSYHRVISVWSRAWLCTK